MKNIRIFYLKFSVLVLQFSVYLNRHVFVMNTMKYRKIPDQAIYLRWLIWIFSVCIYLENTFSHVMLMVYIQGKYSSLSRP